MLRMQLLRSCTSTQVITCDEPSQVLPDSFAEPWCILQSSVTSQHPCGYKSRLLVSKITEKIKDFLQFTPKAIGIYLNRIHFQSCGIVALTANTVSLTRSSECIETCSSLWDTSKWVKLRHKDNRIHQRKRTKLLLQKHSSQKDLEGFEVFS